MVYFCRFRFTVPFCNQAIRDDCVCENGILDDSPSDAPARRHFPMFARPLSKPGPALTP